jgi:glutathione S-transferase
MARARLYTIPQSHYAEKARWALDRAGIDYEERAHAPLFHMLFTVPRGGRTVPLLTIDGRHLLDSTEILHEIDARAGPGFLFPTDPAQRGEVVALEERFDAELGPHVRRWAYAQLLPCTRLLPALMGRGVPAAERWMLPMAMPVISRLIARAFHITPASVERSLARLRACFDEVSACVKDGRRFLVADRFSAADIAFASLAAPALFPPRYGGSLCALDEAPAAMREEVLRLRATPAGAYALRLFESERDQARV